jgi:hypothetical protein
VAPTGEVEGDDVGASGWDYRVTYAGSLEQTLAVAQQEILAGNDYIWPWEDYDPEYLDGEPVPRPASLDELAAAKTAEVFWEEGTHTLLDVERICGVADEDDFAAIRPLSAKELVAVFGTEQPTPGDFERVYEPGPGGALGDLMGPKWSGRSLAIHDSGKPAEVFFWGWSGD